MTTRRRRDRVRPAHRRLRLRHRARLVLDVDRPGRRRQRARHLRLPDVRQLQARRLRPRAVPGDRRRRQTPCFRLQTRDLTPTFGSPLGAQLVDVYVHDPGAATTSTAASVREPQLRDRRRLAWSRLIEVQGFASRLRRRRRARRSARCRSAASQASRYITFACRTPRSAHPARGGGSPSCSRAGRLQPRPGPRVPADAAGLPVRRLCAAPSVVSPICTVDPGTVPKAIDVITPAGRRPVRRARPHAGAGPDRGRRRPLRSEREGDLGDRG